MGHTFTKLKKEGSTMIYKKKKGNKSSRSSIMNRSMVMSQRGKHKKSKVFKDITKIVQNTIYMEDNSGKSAKKSRKLNRSKIRIKSRSPTPTPRKSIMRKQTPNYDLLNTEINLLDEVMVNNSSIKEGQNDPVCQPQLMTDCSTLDNPSTPNKEIVDEITFGIQPSPSKNAKKAKK